MREEARFGQRVQARALTRNSASAASFAAGSRGGGNGGWAGGGVGGIGELELKLGEDEGIEAVDARAGAGGGAAGVPDDRAQRATVALEMERGPVGAGPEAAGGAEIRSGCDVGSASTKPGAEGVADRSGEKDDVGATAAAAREAEGRGGGAMSADSVSGRTDTHRTPSARCASRWRMTASINSTATGPDDTAES